jgi:hypothetical protein
LVLASPPDERFWLPILGRDGLPFTAFFGGVIPRGLAQAARVLVFGIATRANIGFVSHKVIQLSRATQGLNATTTIVLL